MKRITQTVKHWFIAVVLASAFVGPSRPVAGQVAAGVDPQGALLSSAQVVVQSKMDHAAIDDAVLAEMERQELVGVAIGLIQNGQVIYTKGYGQADIKRGVAMSDKTVCNWASNSKPFVAVRALQLIERETLELDAPISTYISDLAEQLRPITVRQLLSHQSGIPHYRNGRIVPSARLDVDPLAELRPRVGVRRFERSPLLFNPGSKYSYSFYAYLLLSAVVEAAGEEPIAEQLAKGIINPLKMKSFQLDMPRAEQSNWTKAYQRVQSGFSEVPDVAHYWKHGAGAYKSNVVDFAKFAQALMTSRLLERASTEEMWKLQPFNNGELSSYGLGVRVSGQGKSLKVWHGGSQEETKTRMVLYPQQRHGIVVLCNTRHADPAAISTAIYRAW